MECPVCYNNQTSCSLVCGHSFCRDCIKSWYYKSTEQCTCPMCRRDLYFKGMNNIVAKWEDERRDEQLQDLFARAFDEALTEDDLDFFGSEFVLDQLICIEERFNKLSDSDYSIEDIEYLIDDFMLELVTDFYEIWDDEFTLFLKFLFVTKRVVRKRSKQARNNAKKEPFGTLFITIEVV